MKQLHLTLSLLLFIPGVFGQKVECRVSLNSGLFSFSGISTQGITSINYDDQTSSGYTNTPWGSKNALCYGFSLKIERVTKRSLIFGFDLGFETLSSKISIDSIYGFTGTDTYQLAATGETFLRSNFINYNPFFGYRIRVKDFSFDLVGGFDVGHCLNTTENGSATDTNGKKYTTLVTRRAIKNDFRARIQLSANYKKAGIYIGYSYGQTNYLSDMIGDNNYEGYSRLIRFGVMYMIN